VSASARPCVFKKRERPVIGTPTAWMPCPLNREAWGSGATGAVHKLVRMDGNITTDKYSVLWPCKHQEHAGTGAEPSGNRVLARGVIFCHGHGPPAVGGCHCVCDALFGLKLG